MFGKVLEPVVHPRPVRPGFRCEPLAAGRSEALLDTQALCASAELSSRLVNFYFKTFTVLIVIVLKN